MNPELAARAKAEPVQLAKDTKPADVDGKFFDLVVVGGTPGGIACAVRAAREGLTVLLVSRTRHLGGMLQSTDCSSGRRSMLGIVRLCSMKWCARRGSNPQPSASETNALSN